MAAILLGAQAFSRRANARRARAEAQRLRHALAVGLPALRKLYEDDLAAFSRSDLPVASGRNQIGLLRTLFGRLLSLDSPEIEAVMAASIAAERVETAMAIGGVKVGGAGFTIPKKHEAREALRAALREACQLLIAAEEILTPNAVVDGESAAAQPASARDSDARRIAYTE